MVEKIIELLEHISELTLLEEYDEVLDLYDKILRIYPKNIISYILAFSPSLISNFNLIDS